MGGFADIYRDALYHGGILSLFITDWFTAHLMHHLSAVLLSRFPEGWQANTLWHWLHNNLDCGAFARRASAMGPHHRAVAYRRQLDRHGLHLRGNTEAYHARGFPEQEAAYPQRDSRASVLHGRGRRDQRRFFDYWLKGIDNGVMDEPPVKLAIRQGRDETNGASSTNGRSRARNGQSAISISPRHRKEPRWVAGRRPNPASESSCSYPASSLGSMGSTSAASSQVMGGGIKPDMGIALETAQFDQDLEVTGPLAAALLGVEFDRGHGSVRHAAQFRS